MGESDYQVKSNAFSFLYPLAEKLVKGFLED